MDNDTKAKFIVMANSLSTGVVVVRNGANSGTHAPDSWHPKNKALDFAITSALAFARKDVDYRVLVAALDAGFSGVGFYRNSLSIPSWHVDTRPGHALWKAVKKNGLWHYSQLLQKGLFS
jgi:hypothetical protein